MIDFLHQYGLFAAKIITILVTLLLGVAGISILIGSKQRERESIEIEKINDKFTNMRDALEEEILSKSDFKNLQKERKKAEKAEEKALKKKQNLNASNNSKSRLFVIRFNGDIQASEVHSLREAITALLLIATKEDEILVILESSGGYVHHYGLAASQLHRIRQREIPLVVSIDLVAASGGYLMAAVAQKILAAPFAVVGSIGVLAQLPNFHRLLKKHDIDVEQHTAGEYKTTLTMFGENTNKAREKFQQELEETHVLFKKFVKECRPNLNIDKYATGEHWYGTQALELNLIDELITSDDYLLRKSEEADIYEVTYVINETLVEKLSTILHGASSKLLNFFKAPIP